MLKKSDIEPIVIRDKEGRPVIANMRMIILDLVLKNGKVTFDEIFDYMYKLYLKIGRRQDPKKFRNFMRVVCHSMSTRQRYLARVKRGVYKISDEYMEYLKNYDYDIKKVPRFVLKQQFWEMLKKMQSESGFIVKVLKGGEVD